MPILDPFSVDAFSLQSMVAAINILPNQYGKITQSGLFKEQGVRTRAINVEEKHGTLNLLQTYPPGSPGQMATKGSRVVRAFNIPHIPYDDVILPDEYEGLRAFGSENSFETLASIMNDHLQNMRNKHDITKEYHKVGALKGILYDADNTVIYNYFNQFLIQRKEVDFLLGTSTTDILGKCAEVARHLEQNLQGETMTRIHAYVDETFWDKFVSHTLVKAAYDRWQEGAALREDLREQGFRFGKITFEEYVGTTTTAGGTVRKFFATDDGVAFPLGTQNVFKTFNCPADFLETVNTLGRPMYAKQEPRKYNRGIDIHTQSNSLNMCMRPALIVRIHTSN